MGPSGRFLIVSADDFGLSAGVNRGIIEAHENGIVTSAGLMVRWDDVVGAAAYARSHPDLDLGLHVDLGEKTAQLGSEITLYEVVPIEDEAAVRGEVTRQLAMFRALVGRDPTHLDSHQHVHLQDPVQSILDELAHGLGVPLRGRTPHVQFCEDFYGQGDLGAPELRAVKAQRLLKILESLPPGFTELGCHPGYDDGLLTLYRSEREQEVRTLTAPRVRRALDELGIQLASFRDVSPRTS
jgi:predicted glycoside hydrolase/deacetylase ChbG (UPF0249 family)